VPTITAHSCSNSPEVIAYETRKSLVTLTALFKDIFVRPLCRTVAIFYTQITYGHRRDVGSFVPPDCVTRVSGQDSQQ